MDEDGKTLTSWVTFAGVVLVVAVLYWAQVVLVPVALAGLLTFVLAPLVTRLQRIVGRVAAVLLVVGLGFSLLGFAGWGLAAQVSRLAADLPAYRANIRQKTADVRNAGKGGSIEQVQTTLDDIRTEYERGTADRSRAGTARPVLVRSEPISSWWTSSAWLGPVVGPLATAGFVIVMVIFMLLEREDLRSRLIGLFGHGHLTVTTKAFDEASQRVSRQLLMQAVVNAIYGAGVGVGLWALGVPYAMFWAALGAALRFIPYVGPIAAAAAPFLVSLAVLPGWGQPLRVVVLFVVLELFTNLVLETVLYAGAAGVSQVALLIAVAFWTWLWGPVGLLLATPLTVCVVVLGKHVRGLEFLSTLMTDQPALAPDVAYYQRLLARDHSGASDFIDRHAATEAPEGVYDELLLRALNYAERDRLEGRLSSDEETAIVDATREMLVDAALLRRTAPAEAAARLGDAAPTSETAATPLPVLAYAVNGDADELALNMLGALLPATVTLDVASNRMLTSEVVGALRARGCRVVCIADLPPSPSSKTRYLVKRIHAAIPELTIVVGRWAPPALADDDTRGLIEAGASHVGGTLLETRDYLSELASRQPASTPDNAAVSAA